MHVELGNIFASANWKRLTVVSKGDRHIVLKNEAGATIDLRRGIQGWMWVWEDECGLPVTFASKEVAERTGHNLIRSYDVPSLERKGAMIFEYAVHVVGKLGNVMRRHRDIG